MKPELVVSALVVELRNDQGEVTTPEEYKAELLEHVSRYFDGVLEAMDRSDEPGDAVAQASSHGLAVAVSMTGRVLRGSGWATVERTLGQYQPEEMAALLVMNLPGLPVAPEGNKLADMVGPCYSTAGVMKLLGKARGRDVSRQAVESRRRKRTIVAARTAEGDWVYPVWQFRDGNVRRDVSELSAMFQVDALWSVASWFKTRARDLEGMSPLEWLDAGNDFGAAKQLAAHTSRRWAA